MSFPTLDNETQKILLFYLLNDVNEGILFIILILDKFKHYLIFNIMLNSETTHSAINIREKYLTFIKMADSRMFCHRCPSGLPRDMTLNSLDAVKSCH